jgi:hypothetical protein
MGFFNKVRGTSRESTREDFYHGLRDLGIEAQMGQRGHTEGVPGISYKSSLGMIDISHGPIRWVNLRASRRGKVADFFADYGVPDPRDELGQVGEIQIELACRKSFPLVFRVTEVYWKGKDKGLGIIDRLNGDILLKEQLMCERRIVGWLVGIIEVTIKLFYDRKNRCWIIRVYSVDSPSLELWNCFQQIAQHLLTTQ